MTKTDCYPPEITPDYVRAYMRTQVKWYTEGKITEENLRFKMDDTRTRYPDVLDYGIEFKIILEELRNELETIKKLEKPTSRNK